MADKKRYKSSEVLNLLFSLPSDVSESEDDLESSDTEPSTSRDLCPKCVAYQPKFTNVF